MTKATHGGKRKGAGRNQIGAARPVRLTPEHIRIAEELGNGNVSAGIRAALEMAATRILEKSRNST